MKTLFRRGLRSATLCALLMVWLPASADWQPTLAAAKHANYHEADEALRIRVPSTVSAEELQTLAVELDAIDVTAMMQWDGEFAVYTPVSPMSPGKHTPAFREVPRRVLHACDGASSTHW